MTVPSKNAIAHIDGKYRGSKWMAVNTLYPYPVLQAKSMGGVIVRMSFWQHKSKLWDKDKVMRMAERATMGAENLAWVFIEWKGKQISAYVETGIPE